MYEELTKKDWLKEWQLSEKDIPDGLIIFGTHDIRKYAKQWQKFLKNSRLIEDHVILGQYKNLKVAFAFTYGPTLASEFIHVFGLLGTPVVIQAGSFGGLTKNLVIGDIFVPQEAERGETVSDCYLPRQQKSDASKDLVKFVMKECKKMNKKCVTGKIFTTAAMLAEKRSDILRWHRQGFVGVDLEASATFAVAKHFKMKRVAIYSLIDNLIEESHLLNMSQKEFKKWEDSLSMVFNLALKTIEFVKEINPRR